MVNKKYLAFDKKRIIVRVPNRKQVCFRLFELDEAIKERDKICQEEGINPYKKSQTRIFKQNTKRKKIKDLPVGVYHQTNSISGATIGYQVNHKENDKHVSKSFYFSRFASPEHALESAIAFRNNYEQRMLSEKEQEILFIKKYGFEKS